MPTADVCFVYKHTRLLSVASLLYGSKNI